MFSGLLDIFLNPIVFYIIFVPLWAIFVMVPFLILKYITIAIEMIATGLPKLLLFGSAEGFSWSNLPLMFMQFSIIAVFIWLLFFVIVLLRYGFMSSEGAAENVKVAAKYSVLCWVYLFLIPIGLFSLYLILDWILVLITGANGANIADEIFKAFKPYSVSETTWNALINNNYLITLDIFATMGGTSGMLNVLFAMVLLVVSGAGMVVAYFFASYTVVGKIFEQFYLFVCSPFVAVSSILDGGKKVAILRDHLISKSLVVFAIIIGSKIFASLAGWITKNASLITGIEPSADIFQNLPNSIVIILLCVGGAFTFVNFGQLVSDFIGGDAGRTGISEGKAGLKSGWKATQSTVGGLIGAGAGGLGLVSGAINRAKGMSALRKNQQLDPSSLVGWGKRGRERANAYAESVNAKQNFKNARKGYKEGNKMAEEFQVETNIDLNDDMATFTGYRNHSTIDTNRTNGLRQDYYKELESLKKANKKKFQEIYSQKHTYTQQEFKDAINKEKNNFKASVDKLQKRFKNEIDQLNKEASRHQDYWNSKSGDRRGFDKKKDF